MRVRYTLWILLGLLVVGGAWFMWPAGPHGATAKRAIAKPDRASQLPASSAPLLFAAGKAAVSTNASAGKTNRFAYRLSNTPKTISQLMSDPRGILLENALIDSSKALMAIPKNLQAQGEPGAYIVQARGPVDNGFRATLAAAGAQIVSYIPNNAYLVTISAGGAAGLVNQSGVQTVIPYEPYYKLPETLLAWVGKSFPADRQLRVAAYPNTADQLRAVLVNSGAQILTEEPSSPFGKTFIIQNVTDVAALARQATLQRVEPAFRRAVANDLSRVTMGISADTVTPDNYLGLSGKNVLVEVNDTGIDATHPDFSTARVTGVFPSSLFDTNGHGTFVAGVIAGNGSQSLTPVNIGSVAQGSVTNADFRGKAPLASLYSLGFLDVNGNSFDISDSFLQETPARTNALISNNSWTYVGDNTYNLAAASYDAAVRDALPLVTGSQPVLFVFAAGNDGGGNDDGGGGDSDTILSPGTSKNVITVGALEQLRNITNSYTPLDSTNEVAVWAGGTDSGTQVAGYSGRGNVGIGSEGAYGRFKPDVVAPGSFVVSTRSQQWDEAAYYNPTNYYFQEQDDQLISARSVRNENLSLNFSPPNVTFNSNIVAVKVFILPNLASPSPFPNLPIFVSHLNYPNPTVPASFDFVVTNTVSIPPDGGPAYLSLIQNGNLFMTILNTNSYAVPYDFVTEIVTTNQAGNYFEVLSNLNDTLAPFYRYESGTSVAAPGVSGMLALMQDYFTNTLRVLPTPALMKALLINGSRPVGDYSYNITNDVNFEGWGLPGLPTILPPGVTNQINKQCTSFFLDQDSTNALATGDRRTFTVTVDDTIFAQVLPLQVTLAWTDPPGNPAAALKLVNNLDLVVTNLDTGEVYFGNDIFPGTTYNLPWDTNGAPNLDVVNNVETVIVPPLLGGSYSITVIGTSVNVNAVTAQTNNTVQDFALVISSGNGEITNGLMVAAGPLVSHPTTDQQVTPVYVDASGMATNSTQGGVFLNQLAGANTPLLGTNTVGAGGLSYATNALVTLGMTNQWHFYVVQNNTTFSNAGFISFLPNTLAIPRMGVFADSDANATQPDADIDMYVSTNPSLTNLNPVVISNCVHGTQVGASLAGVFNGASLSGGGTEFIVDTNSTGGQTYYIGIKSETAEAVEYGFLPVFSQLPFSQTDANGNETVRGLLLPVAIPDGTPKHPGRAYIFALAIQPIQVENVIVTDQIYHQNFGDLIGTLSHGGQGAVLNNHDSLPPGFLNFIYDDGPAPVAGSQPPDGPGSLQNFQGQQGIGPWLFTQLDDSLTQTGAVTAFNLLITPHQDLNNPGINISVQGGGFFHGFIDVPAGVTNLTIAATNTMPFPDSSPLTDLGQLFERFGSQLLPTQVPPTNYDKMVTLSNFPPATPTTFPGGVITIGPSDVPPIQPGRYYVTLYNPSTTPQTYFIIAKYELGQAATVDFGASGPTNLLDDAVSYSSVFVTNRQPIAALSVGLRVDHPRISDLVFHLISPDGSRFLLMENRGALSTNGCGVTIISTNDFPPVSFSGGPNPVTNIVNVGQTSGTVAIDYNFFTAPDTLSVFYQGARIFNSGLISGSGTFQIPYGPGTSSNLTIVMNEFTNPQPSTIWNYLIHSVQTNYYYLTLTQNTNLTTTPIKFAPTPFVPANFFSTNYNFGNFESATAGVYAPPSLVNGWNVIGGQVSVVTDPATAYQGSNFMTLANGTISNNVPTLPGGKYTLSYACRGPGIISWWRGESNTLDSAGSNNGLAVGALGYVNGEVGKAYSLNGSSYVSIPNAASLTPSGGFSIDAWIYPTQDASQKILSKWGDQGSFSGQRSYSFGTEPGLSLAFSISDLANQNNGAFHTFMVAGVLTLNTWNHVAATYNSAAGIRSMYVNGMKVASHTNAPVPVYNSIATETIGAWLRAPGSIEGYFHGSIDEVSLYGRFMSDSEIKAIYTDGTAGKFDPNAAIPQNLAKAAVSINGAPANIYFGNNGGWQVQNIQLTATQVATPVVITGLEPGILLDSFSASRTVGGNLYYLPEQSLDPLIGTSAYGTWQLEIQDDRVGATNRTILQSWALQFVFANTNPIPALINSGNTNFIPPGGLAWYQVDVPTNADFATNILTFATGPLNMWYSTNVPPTITNAPGGGDTLILPNSTGGSVLLGTNGYPNIVPGGTYYLGIQNPGAATVQYGVQVNFHLLFGGLAPFAFTEPATLITGSSAQLNGMATANGLPSTAWFRWGSSQAYGTNTPPVNIGTNYSVTFVSTNITGLTTNFAIHYQLVVSNVAGVTYGFDQVFAQGSVVTWGSDFAGQTIPVPSSLTNLVAGVGAGYDFSLALNFNGTVVAWGDDAAGQTNVPTGLTNAVAVAGGNAYSLALGSDRMVRVWGDDTYNQSNGVPANLTNAVAATAGAYHCIALRDDGNPVAWGRNSNGQTNIPAGLSNVVAVAAGFSHSLALKNDGTVVAWGNNTQGQTNVPVGLTNVVAIAAGHDDSLALRSDGTVVAWGSGFIQTNVPASLTNVTAITAGYYHCQALKADGSVWFWGDSGSGQLNGYPANLTNVFAISGGGFHTLSVQAPYGLNITNTPPYWTNGLDSTTVTMGEQTTRVINNAALDLNAPPQLVFYSFATNAPPFASIDAFTGLITLSPLAGDGPSTNLIATVATDNGYPPLSATNRFTLIVTSTNVPPVPPFTNAVPVSGIIHTNLGGTNGFLLTWFAPSNALFQVQWTTSLFPATWMTFTNPPLVSYNPAFPASLTSATFNFFDDGSQTGGFGATRFYRLITVGTMPPPTNTVPISGIVLTNGQFRLTWLAPTNNQFNVRWATNLTPPITWTIFPGPVTSTTGTFTFTDTNAPLLMKFYQLILLP